MVKAAKKATCAVVRDRDVTDEELITVFAGVESLLNSRLLTYQSSDPRDSVPLTPNHFLHGQIGGQFAPEYVQTYASSASTMEKGTRYYLSSVEKVAQRMCSRP